jgi:hypothetical protein
VVADGKRLVGHAGAVLLRRAADRTRLTDAPAGVLPYSKAAGWRDRAGVVVHLVIAIVPGAWNLSEAEQLQLHHQALFGLVASDSTVRRTLSLFHHRSELARYRVRTARTRAVIRVVEHRSFRRSRQFLRVAMACSTRARIFAWERLTDLLPRERVSHRPQYGIRTVPPAPR